VRALTACTATFPYQDFRLPDHPGTHPTDIFDLRQRLVDDYERYITSFIKIADARIDQLVQQAISIGQVPGYATQRGIDSPEGG
jgi:hypothetical protein